MRSTSLLLRALLALALMAGFYALALGVAAGLLYIPYAQFTQTNLVYFKLGLACIAGAVAILIGIMPRRDRFEAPGPRLEPRQHPRLFQVIERVAKGARQRMPAEVYLVGDVNAFVTQRGGVMGFGSRRVMGLGLPLLHVLSVAELEAVLAHEFGHFHGGDVLLGPWVYKTREAIGRTLVSLEESGRKWLQMPFDLYGELFLSLTTAVSRHQELAADRLAAELVGAKALSSGLRKVAGADMAFGAYWSDEVAPALKAGLLPPLGEGFAGFFARADVSSAVTDAVRSELRHGKAGRFDTHPSLRDRLNMLRTLPAEKLPASDPPAATLLGPAPGLERALLASLSSGPAVRDLKPASWIEVGRQVWKPQWIDRATSHAAALRGLAVDDLPRVLAAPDELARTVARLEGGQEAALTSPRRVASWSLGTAFAAALARAGYDVAATPGQPVRFSKDGMTLEPFTIVDALASGKLSPEDFSAGLQRAGLSGLSLVATSAWSGSDGIPLSR